MSMTLAVRLLLRSTVLGAAISAVACPAFAQTKAASQNQLEEIVVTARKTSEKLQTTPVAVTAITPQAMERRQIKEVNDLVRSTPSLTSNGAGTAPASIVYLSIRGNVQVSPNSASDSSVGIYIDGVYYGRPMIGNLGLLDMASAEVLRGPQGTLFGRNTTGGALNITTQQPTNKFEGYVKVGIGNYDQRLVEGVVNTPLSDSVAARFSARYTERSGYVTNDANGRKMNDIDGDYYVRGSVKWAPEDKPVELLVTADYGRYKDNGTGAKLTAVTPFGPLATGPAAIFSGQSPLAIWDSTPALLGLTRVGPTLANALLAESNKNGFYHVSNGPNTGDTQIDTPVNSNRAKGISANLNVDFGEVRLKSITAYRESDTYDSLDLDGAPTMRPVFGAGGTYSWQPVTASAAITQLQTGSLFTGGGQYWNGLAFFSRYRQRQVSEELQLSGSVNKLDWITGLYGYTEKGTEISDAWQVTDTSRDYSHFHATSLGAFAQVNYHFTDRLRGTAGFRYTWDTRNINRHGGGGFVIANGAFTGGVCGVGDPVASGGPNGSAYNLATCNEPHTAHFQYPAWLASLDYKFDDNVFGYLKTSGAALSGGFNTRIVPAGSSQSFNPEHVKDIELGVKSDFLNKKLRTNVAVYYQWRNGVQNQLSGAVNGRSTQFVVNSGNVRSYGVEGELTVLPWDGMEVTAAGSYLHAKYAKGTFQDVDAPAQILLGIIRKYDRSDEPVLQSPKYTLNLGATQAFDLPWGKVSFHGDYSYRSSEAIDYVTPPPSVIGTPAEQAYIANNANSFLKGYGIINARVAFNISDPDVEIAFWGKNIGNTHYYTQQFNVLTALGYKDSYLAAPRMYGATVAYHW